MFGHNPVIGYKVSGIYQKTLEYFGIERQLQKLCEECAECIVAIHHWRDKKATQDEVASEVADVIIMAEQMKLVLEPGLVDAKIKEKLERLIERIAK